MKKIIHIAVTALMSLAALSGCRNAEQEVPEASSVKTVRFHAGAAPTRTAFTEAVDGVYQTLWTENDSDILLSLNYESVKESLEEGEYEKALPYVDNWGIYVMYARYADCNGVTLSMPDGIAPDFEAEDDPLDGYALGDPGETMLATALGLIEGRTRSAATPSGPRLTPVPEGFHPRSTGLLVGRL